MENFNLAMRLMEEIKQTNLQYQEKPTKVLTKEMRRLLTELKNIATDAKRDLIALDEQTTKHKA